MKIPNKIHFCGFDYEVVFIEELDRRDNWGRTSLDRGKIFIEKSMSEQKQQETFIHELLHIAFRSTAYGLTDNLEENVVKAWSQNIYGILKDNNLLK